MMDEESRWNVLMRAGHAEPDGSHGTDWSERVSDAMTWAGSRTRAWYLGWHYAMTLLCWEDRFEDLVL